MRPNRLQILFEFIFDPQGQLFLVVEGMFKNEAINLSLSTLLQFLFEHEKELSAKESEFCYSLAKFIKKVQIGPKFYFAIPNESDIALFFVRARDHQIPLSWRYRERKNDVHFGGPLPLTFAVGQHHQNLKSLRCHFLEREIWLEDPLYWQTFSVDDTRVLFSNGTIILNLPEQFEHFINRFLDQPFLSFAGAEAISFIQEVYTPHKKIVHWQVKADFPSFLPKTTPPIPVLDVSYESGSLCNILRFKYGKVIMEPSLTVTTVADKASGKQHQTMPDMEAIYQQDLMELFQKNDLPFLLQSPGDIAKFMHKVVPVLKGRKWQVSANVPEFEVYPDAVDLEFGISSSDLNWFHFEPNCTVLGQAISLQEIARLLVQNQGYIQTKKGYVKVSGKSQEELQLLAGFGAFSVGRKFQKAELIPMIATTAIRGTSDREDTFVNQTRHFQRLHTCIPGTGFKGTLRSYQQYGVNWMQFLYHNGFGGILADDMGLGKTIQTIAFLSQLELESPILVLCPTNVIYNWESELKKFLPHFKTQIYGGSNRQKQLNSLDKIDVIITSFGVMRNDLDYFSQIPFQAIFIDEAQYIKNPDTHISKAVKALNGRFKLALSGTPIENHLSDLWNLFDAVMPAYLGDRAQFESAIKDHPQQRARLKTKIQPFILRREKREVLDSLPEKTEIVVKCPLSPEQEKLYKTVLSAAQQGIRDAKGKSSKLNMLTALLKLRQVCTHPGLIKELQNQSIPSAKFDILTEKLLELVEEDHKVVVFSQFTGMLDIVQKWLQERAFNFERIDGSISGQARMAAIERFQSSPEASVFLVSLKAGGVGINLTAADYVIHLDPWWNPAAESQATDRVHRMGQQNKVFVYKLIAQGTIEEKIQELQDQKRALYSELIDIDSLADKQINLDELKVLLTT